MDIDRVRYFCVFASMGSLTQASEVLHISQPALSKALKTLESELNTPLMEREGRGLVLTKEGKVFYQKAKPLLESWLNLGKDIHKSERIDDFTLGSFEVFTTYFLDPLLKNDLFPKLNIFDSAPGELERAVAEKRIDLGITYIPIPTPGVIFKEATQIRSGVFGVKDKNWNTQTPPFVVPIAPIEGTPSKMIGLDGWPDHKYARHISYKVSLMQSALEIVRNGRGIVYLPKFVAHIHNQKVRDEFQLEELACPIPVAERKQNVYLIQRQGERECPKIRSIARVLRSLKKI